MKLINLNNFDMEGNTDKLKFEHDEIQYTITEDIEGGIRLNKVDMLGVSDRITINPAFSNEIIIN